MAGGWLLLKPQKNPDVQLPAAEVSATQGGIESIAAEQKNVFNPLANSGDANSEENVSSPSIDQTTFDQLTPPTDNVSTNNLVQSHNIEAATVALEPLSDDEFHQLERLMRTDPDLRMDILEEFRYNTNPERAKQLAALLGEYNDPEIVQTASELAYSGDPQSQIAGLDLLARLQPGNPEARDVAINLLSSESNSSMLVATMNVLATPTGTATAGQRQLLTDNLSNLSLHRDANVRAHSIALMGRWDKNSATSKESFTRGLSDTDPAVRAGAAYALNNVQEPNEDMINGLLAIAENANEKKATRYAALNALGSMSLTSTAQRLYNAAKISINRRPARNN